MRSSSTRSYVMVMGMATFATFFGAGNLIFPAYLGLHSGSSWFTGFLFYILVDAGLAGFCIVACALKKGGFKEIMDNLDPMVSKLILALNALILGPLIVAPRTAATTFSLSFKTLFPELSSWIVTFVFFSAVLFLCINPSKVVETIGRFLAPVLLAGLTLLIIRGIMTLRCPIELEVPASQASKDGLLAGYQTMDMLGAALFYTMLTFSAEEHRIEPRRRIRCFAMSALIAVAGLFTVYMGLCYLGAVTSSVFSPELDQAELLVAITELVLGKAGKIMLAVIVLLACLTTAVGVLSSCARTFEQLFSLKDSYGRIIVASVFFSFVISNIGLSNIIRFAGPLLEIIYPVIMICIMLSVFGKARPSSYKLGAALTFAAVSWSVIDGSLRADLGSSLLPLSDMGLGWMLPAFAGIIAGGLFGRKASEI